MRIVIEPVTHEGCSCHTHEAYISDREIEALVHCMLSEAKQIESKPHGTWCGSWIRQPNESGSILTCPMCKGIGEVYAVNRDGGPFWIPRSYQYLTQAEKEREKAHLLVTDRCHGCLGRGLISVESLREPFARFTRQSPCESTP